MLQQFTGTDPVPHAAQGEKLAKVEVTTASYGASSHDLHPKSWLRRFPVLSPRMAELMVDGDVESRYGSTDWKSGKKAKSQHKHAITAAAAAAARRYGWTRDQFTEAMLDCPSAAGRGAREMSLPSAHRYLDKVWDRARHLVTHSTVIASREDAVVELIALRDKIASSSWRGTAESTAMRVLMAHWDAAKKAGGRMHTLSHREAAEKAGCQVRTSYLASKRLVESGWLRLVESGTSDKGSTWCLLDGTSQERHSPRGAQPGGTPSSVSTVRNGELDGAVIERLMGLDAFAHRGLGASSLKLLAALHLRDRQSVGELLETAMVSQATAYRHLTRLAEHDLVAKQDGLWELTQTATEALEGAWEGWDTVAAEVGTYGTAWRRQQAHKDQRAVWRGMVVPRLRERRAADVVPIRGDEAEPCWVADGCAIDPATGEIMEDLVVASDGRFLLVVEDLDYDELVRRNALACAA